jgi:putative inorganic carbon (HCO3(-)) transporter
MLRLCVFVILGLISVATLFRPWIGAVSYVVLSVWAPQTFWFWAFEGVRASFIIAGVTGVSFMFHMFFGSISLSCWKTKQNAVVLFFWLTILCSYFLGGLPPNTLRSNVLNSGNLLERYNKIFIMFFLLQAVITDIRVISYLVWALVPVFAHYTYWANNQYLSGAMFLKYSEMRLGGPSGPDGSGNFIDQNGFAMLFVMAVPFFYFLAQENKNKFIKIILYLLIPLAWHSVFLTGSRGGLVGLGIISLHIAYRSRKKLLGVLVIVGLVAAFITQGGELMKQRSDTIVDYQGDPSAMGRIEAWTLASKMVEDHPIFGVGLGNFTVAWKEYKDTKPRVAHSTIIQIAAEDGIISALAFLAIFVIGVMDLRDVRKAVGYMYGSDPYQAGHILSIANALEGACIGFFICGLFLNLGLYEIFYIYILIIALLKTYLLRANAVSARDLVPIGSHLQGHLPSGG